jgi:hypothetical protein
LIPLSGFLLCCKAKNTLSNAKDAGTSRIEGMKNIGNKEAMPVLGHKNHQIIHRPPYRIPCP